MSGVADRDRAQARLPRLCDRKIHRFAADHLAVAELPVDDGMARRFANDGRVPVGEHHAAGVPVEVLRHADDAMRVVSGKIGVDQMIADQASLPRPSDPAARNIAATNERSSATETR